jgi:hypothetical protein
MGADRELRPIGGEELVAIVAELEVERTAPTTKAVANGARPPRGDHLSPAGSAENGGTAP